MGLLLAAANVRASGLSGNIATFLRYAAAAVAAAYALGDVLQRPIPVPTRHWLVPRRWSHYGPTRWSLMFGASLGVGYLTIVPFVGFHLFVLAGAFFVDAHHAFALFLLFGVGRAASTTAQIFLTLSEQNRSRTAPDLTTTFSAIIIPGLRISALTAFGVAMFTELR